MIPAGAGAVSVPVLVQIAEGRTKSAEEWAQEITDKILSVGDTAPEPLRLQALHFKDQIFRVVRDNLILAIHQEREWMSKQTRT